MSPGSVLHPVTMGVDIAEAARFHDALAGVSAKSTFQTFSEKGGPIMVLHGTFAEHAAKLWTANEQGACVCVTVNQTDLHARKAENIVRVRAVFVDVDQPEADPLAQFAAADLPPHVVVESSPGKAHAYWLVADCPLSQFARVQSALIHRFGGDPACKDLPRLMRLPGFIHWKSEPFRSRIVAIRHAEPYPLLRINDVLLAGPWVGGQNPAASAKSPPRELSPATRLIPIGLRGVIQGAPEGARDKSLFKLACGLRAQDFAYEEARDLVLCAAANCTPPFGEAEALKKLEQAWKYPAGTSFEKLTDVGNARRFVTRYGDIVRWIIEFKKWLLWKDDHWQLDIADEVMQLGKATTYSIYEEAAKCADSNVADSVVAHAKASQQLPRLRAMLELARTEPGVFIGQHVIDCDPWLLGVQNGVVELRTGHLRPARPEDLITKRTSIAYDATAECPVWLGFVDKIMGGDKDLIRFLQRAVGYSMSGLTTEQCLFFLFGMGSNGKSTFLKTLEQLLDGYAASCQPDTLMSKKAEGGVNNDIARLRGARFVSTIEAEEGKRFAEALIKQMTGDDTLVARFLFQEHFEYRPQFKIWLAANHKPIIRGDDHAIWRRIRLIPFAVTIADNEKDKDLAAKLVKERAGILRWAIEGCLAWQREGLSPPASVSGATDSYRAEMDVFGAWLKECCETHGSFEESVKTLFESYRRWCDETEIHTHSKMKFSLKLKERGFRHEHTRHGAVYHGLKVR
jgi:putative DNA primase/helicase